MNFVTIKDDRAYLGCYLGGVQIVNISDRSFPVLTGKYDDPPNYRFPKDLFIKDSLGFVVYDNSPFDLLDMRDPDSLVKLSGISTGAIGEAVEVVDNTAYVGNCSEGLNIIRASWSEAPVKLGNYRTPGIDADDVAMYGHYACIADHHTGILHIVDVSDPAHPVAAATDTIVGASLSRVFVQGAHAFVGSSKGLHIFDISDPASPEMVSEYLCGRVLGLWVNESGTVFVGTGYTVKQLDVGDPANPRLTDSVYVGWGLAIGSLTGAGPYIYAASNSALHILHMEEDMNAGILAPVPSVSAQIHVAAGRIGYSLGHSDRIRFNCYDLTGRRIGRLDEGYRNPGEYYFPKPSGTSGIFLYRLETGAGTVAKTAGMIK